MLTTYLARALVWLGIIRHGSDYLYLVLIVMILVHICSGLECWKFVSSLKFIIVNWRRCVPSQPSRGRTAYDSFKSRFIYGVDGLLRGLGCTPAWMVSWGAYDCNCLKLKCNRRLLVESYEDQSFLMYIMPDGTFIKGGNELVLEDGIARSLRVRKDHVRYVRGRISDDQRDVSTAW